MRVRTTFLTFGGALAAGIILAATVSSTSVNQVRVGGPTYEQIIQGKDLVADILPPPAYVIEAYLEATLALNRASPLADSAAKLTQLRTDYNDRHKYWVEFEPDAFDQDQARGHLARACRAVLDRGRAPLAAGA